LYVAPGENEILVSGAPRGYRAGLNDFLGDPVKITLAENETKTAAPFKLERSIVLAALVTDEAGVPLGDMPLQITERNAPYYGGPSQNKTDAKGVWSSERQQ